MTTATSRSSCPLDCGSDADLRAIEAGGITVFICPECLGVAFDAAVLCDPRRPVDLTRILRPVIESIRRENSIDPLTQTKNRAFFFKRLAAEIAAANHRSFISVAAFAFDLDALYAKHGARHGNMIVQSLAASLVSAIRTGDDLARVEPDTFSLIIRNADETTAFEIASRVASHVRVIAPGNGHPTDISIVLAVAPADAQEAEAVWSGLLERVRGMRAQGGNA